MVGDPTVTYTHRRGRKKKYTQELVPFLKACWVLSNYCCSVHLKVFIEQNRNWLLSGLKQQAINGFSKGMGKVEINSHWTELRALKNKAYQWTHKALQANDQTVPF